MESVLLYDEH